MAELGSASICRRERYHFFNSLSILLKAVEEERTTIDLRNEASISGIVELTDAYMNVVMRDCVFTDPRGDSFKYDMFFVHARKIRCVHIPPSIIPAIKKQLQQLRDPLSKAKDTRNTYRTKRAQQRQQEDLEATERILANETDS